MEELFARLKAQEAMPASSVKICRGRLVSPTDFVVDVSEWGFATWLEKESTRSMNDPRTDAPPEPRRDDHARPRSATCTSSIRRASLPRAVAEMSEVAEVVALCGDSTISAKTREVENLLSDLQACHIPVVAVLGNHD
jgi:hypothetical protein